MKINTYNYKKRKICPKCLSLSIKKSHDKFKCDKCKNIFNEYILIEIMHKGNRCIDNDIESRFMRYDKKMERIIYDN